MELTRVKNCVKIKYGFYFNNKNLKGNFLQYEYKQNKKKSGA